MEVRHFKLIKEVAEKGSLTKAMDTLFLSQSALSHQLKEIETQLGGSLFHRINKKLVLTGAGKIMLESARRILADIENTELSVKKHFGGDTGTVRIATQCYTCYHWLPSLMIDFHKEFPQIEIEIFSDEDVDTEKQILDGKLDLAIVSSQRDYSQLTYHELFKDESIALVPKGHPWAKKKYVNAKDFETENLIIHSYPLETVDLFRKVLMPEGIKPKKVMQIQVIDAVLEMVRAGMGVKVIAKWMVEPYLEDKRLVAIPVTKKGLHRTWHAVTLKKDDSPQYLANFIDHLKCNIGGICRV
jgi:LysR family transcriptional regulator, regulator for metE and metH